MWFKNNFRARFKGSHDKKFNDLQCQLYTKTCDLCDKKFENSKDMKKHKEAKYKYENCEFVEKRRETMEVHF